MMEAGMDPIVGVIQFCSMPTLLAAIRTAIYIDLFEIGDTVWLLDDVAVKKGIDPTLLLRLMRVLCSFKIFEQTDRHQYGPSPMSLALAEPSVRDWVVFHFDVNFLAMQKLPDFLRSTSFRNPDGNPLSPAKHALGSEYFEYLHQNPEMGQAFDSAMKISDLAPPVMVPQFPYMEQALSAAASTKEELFFLDIGGGRGQFVQRLLVENPEIPCKFIVQDLEPTTATMDLATPKIQGMVQDFFDPQSVKGARWYNFRRVLHDWPDATCRKILASTTPAMKKGYSTMLIQEYVMPDKGYSQIEALIDFGMSVLTGIERTEEQWRILLASEGLQIIKIWPANIGALSIIEAELT